MTARLARRARRWWTPATLALVALAVVMTLVVGWAGPSPADAGALARQEGGDEPAPQAGEEAEVDPFDRLAGCVGASGRLLVVLLVDESASLRETDPDDQRVVAARTALRSLDLLRDAGEGEAVEVDVLVSTFSFDFQPVGGWTTLTDDTRADVDELIGGLADRDESMDTDFHNALEGAREALADRATESTAGAGGDVCKSVLLFTDGNFTLGARETEEQRERYGTTKVYAPDVELTDQDAVDEVTRAGVDALCREGGVADAVRDDRITLVTVPLGEGADLLEALTAGRSEGGRACGDPETDQPGVYLPASDTDELLRTFDLVASRIGGGSLVGDPVRAVPCEEDDCDEASVSFSVSPSLRRVHVFASVPGGEGRVVLVPPEGDRLVLAPGEDASEDVGGIPVTAEWLTDRAATIDLAVPADGSGAGTWTVALVGREGDAKGSIHVLTFSDLVARLDEGSRLRLGEEATLTATVGTRDGEPSSEELREIRVTGTLADPVTGDVVPIAFTEADGAFVATHTVDPAVTAAGLRASLRLEATTATGARLTSVSPEVDLAVLRPEGYPQVAPPRLELSSITGNGTARGDLVLVAPDGAAGCAWLEDLTVRGAPDGAGDLSVEAEAIGDDAGSCTEVSGPLTVPVEVDASGRASGSVTGHVRLYLARAGGDEPIATDVPFSFEMARGVDEAKRLALAAVLMVSGMLIPGILLVLINLATTRFQPLGNVRAARVPVVLTGRDQLLRTDGVRRPFVLTPDDFTSLEGRGGDRSFTWGGLTFRARTPLNPFAEPHATIEAEAGGAGVSREGRRTDLALGLAGSWLFLLDQDATREAAERVAVPGAVGPTTTEIHGHVVAFVAEDAADAQTGRVLGDVDARLPATARQLARVAHL